MVGLLHDIGRLVLITSSPQHYEPVLVLQASQDCYMIEAERAVLGIDHTIIGRALAQCWKFPILMQKAIESHHAPDMQEAGSLASIVHCADCIVHALDLVGDEQDIVPPVSARAWNGLNLDQKVLMRVFRETEMQFEEACQILV